MTTHITVHPSLDIKNNNLFLGYSHREHDIKSGKFNTANYHLIATPGENESEKKISLINNHQFSDGNTTYYFEPSSDNKERRLMKLEDKWSLELLERSADTYKTIDGMEIYSKLKNQLKKHVKFESEIEYDIVSTWIIMSYFFPVFPAIPYLHIKAVKGSGKTTTLDFIKQTAFNASKESATYAAMRDRIDGQRGVFIVDQADNLLGTQCNNQMVDIFTDSYKKSGGKVSKMVEDGKKQVVAEFDTYSPKVFASIRELNMDLRDRCIQIRLIRAIQNLEYLDSDSPIWLEIRNGLYNFQIANYNKIADVYRQLYQGYLATGEITGRKLELWLPMETLASILGVSEECVNDAKQYFLARSKDTEAVLSPAEWQIIDKILEIIEKSGLEYAWIRTDEVARDIEFDNADDDLDNSKNNKNRFVGNIINRLSLSSEKEHTNKGNQWKFYKDKVEYIKKAYSPNKDSHPLTTNLDTVTEVSSW